MSQPLPRLSLAATCLGHAVIFGGAAAVLPWRSGTTFAITFTLLSVMHVVTGVMALLRQPQWLIWAWRALSVASGLAFVIIGWSMAAAALYVAKLYLRLGPSVATGIAAAAVVLGLLTLPMAIWGARHTWPSGARSARRLGIGASALVVFAVLTLPLASSAAVAEPVHQADSRLASELTNLLEEFVQREPSRAHQQRCVRARSRQIA